MKIYTKRGDSGETDLFAGGRVGKDDPRVEAYGSVDEVNAAVGLAAAHSGHDEIRTLCQSIQSVLFTIGGVLATEPTRGARSQLKLAEPEDVAQLEAAIDRFEAELSELRAFVLPGGTVAAGAFHLARTTCRRAERRVVTLAREAELPGEALRYLNRLSDLLFVLSRVENHRAGVPDVEWRGRDA